MTTTNPPQTEKRPIVLTVKDQGTQVMVCPEEEQGRFVVTMAEAVRACQALQSAKQFHDAFQRFMYAIRLWCEKHTKDVLRAYVAPATHGLEVFIVVKGEAKFRFDLQNDITGLDLSLAERFKSCPAHVMQLPNVSQDNLSSFIDFERALQVYGE